jgi:toxin YoeB
VIVAWSGRAWEDYVAWQEEDRATARRINRLIAAIRRDPFRGEGKPEPLRGVVTDWWSRRITAEHRLVYRVRGSGEERMLQIAQCRLHY